MSSYNPFSLEGKTILVTGASSGIGKATAIECSKMGATVILTGRNQERLDETLSELKAYSALGHKRVVADLSNTNAIERLVDELPLLDGVVCNAGVQKTLPVQFITKQELENILNVNTIAPVLIIRLLLKKKKISKGASIVFTSSIGGVYTTTMGNTMYGISKGGINAFMKGVALELAIKGIRSNSVNPGLVETNLVSGIPVAEEDIKRNMEKYPLKRFGRPEEIAYAIIYLLSDASSWVTGHSLVIDGGITLR